MTPTKPARAERVDIEAYRAYAPTMKAHVEPRMLAILADLEATREELAEAQREADRLRHGNTIEGDFVCPNELMAISAGAEIDRLRDALLRAEVDRNIAVRAQNSLATKLARLSLWADNYGQDLIPRRADTYGEGMREAKRVVKEVIVSEEKS